MRWTSFEVWWALTAVTAGVATATLASGCGRGAQSCEALVSAQAWDRAVVVCRAAYERDRSASAGVAAARSLLRSDQPEAAEQLARELIASERAGDAFLVLGDAAARRGDSGASLATYEQALRVHERDRNAAGASRAANGLAGAWLARGDLARAMAASQRAIDHAARASDAVMQLYATLGHADLLRRRGSLVAAEADLARAADLAGTLQDKAWVDLKRGILYIDRELDPLARESLERVLATSRRGAVSSEVVMAAHLNLAWIERRSGALAEAMRHVEAAAALDPDDADVHVNRALVLADQQRVEEAARELRRAAQVEAPGSGSWWVAYNQGLIAARRGDALEQRAAFRRAIESVRALSSRAGSYAPEVAASHRQPFLRLIGLHARGMEWKAALALVMELDALALLSTERAPARHPADEPAPRPADPPAAHVLPAVDAVLEAWRGRHLVIAISDEETVWRIEVRDGRVIGEAVGAAASLEHSASKLEQDPGDPAAASALGAALVPPSAAREVLDLLLIGPIARAPLAALTRDGRAVADRTPLARVLGILPRRARRAGSGKPVVLGDPQANLPSARAEAVAVAARLGATPLLGPLATSAALADAASAGLLHVAAHSTIDEPLLLMADRAVSRDDILASGRAPAVVVLASCGSLAARDDAGWGSLAGSYIAAGADAVLASAWSIEDAGARSFVEELYHQPVREQPARALAAAQARSRAALPPRVWAGFTIIAAPPTLSM